MVPCTWTRLAVEQIVTLRLPRTSKDQTQSCRMMQFVPDFHWQEKRRPLHFCSSTKGQVFTQKHSERLLSTRFQVLVLLLGPDRFWHCYRSVARSFSNSQSSSSEPNSPWGWHAANSDERFDFHSSSSFRDKVAFAQMSYYIGLLQTRDHHVHTLKRNNMFSSRCVA